MKNQKYPNLKPWQPGQSGNPAGRKPGSKNISTIVRELLDQEASNDVLAKSSIAEMVQGQPTSYAKAIVQVTIKKALKGDMRAIIWLTEQQNMFGAEKERLTQEPVIISHLKPRFQSTVD
jgi:hypothetical protein